MRIALALVLAVCACDDGTEVVPDARPAPAADAATGPPQDAAWSFQAPMLQPRSEMAVAELGGKIYVIGGYPPGRIPSNVVQVYDPASDSWSLGPPTPVPLHHAIALAVDDRLFLIGGEFNGAGTGLPPVFLDDVHELDVATNTWLPRAPMPTARSGAGAGVIDGKIYVAGGRPPRGRDFAVYDPAENQWTKLPSLPTARNHLAVDAIGGKLYVAGGRFDAGVGGPMTAALEVFDPVTGDWTTAAPMPAPRAGVTAIAAFGCLYVIGGEGNAFDPVGIFEHNEAYDPRTNSWHLLTRMPTPTHGLNRGAFLDGRIHIPGGAVTLGGDTGTTLHQVYDPERHCDE